MHNEQAEQEHNAAWEAIRKIHPWLPSSREGWHQHPNGGGWVSDQASVAEKAFVGRGAIIRGGVIWGGTILGGVIRGGEILGGTIWGGTILGGVIWGGTILGGVIRGGEILGGTIWGGTILGGEIRGGVIRGGEIRGGTILGGEITQTPVLIFGSRYWICCSGPGLISIACITKPLAWWLEHVERCAEEHGYNATQQKEYRLHVEHVAAWMRLYGMDKEEEPVSPEKKGKNDA